MKKVVLILAVVFSTMTQAQEHKPQVPQISVTGEGKIKVVPDRAIISVGVLNTGKDSKEVKTLNDETVDKVIKFLKKSGIAATDYKTDNVSLYKNYDYEKKKYNFQASQNISITLKDLSKYDVYVVDEPNILFTAAQKTAIMNFVKNGGGLFMIANHNGSDRNNDGRDSAAIWNDLMANNSVQNNPFGLSVELVNFSQTTTNVLNDATNTILNGSQGAVTQLKFSAGASIKITPTANASVKGLIWKTGLAKTSTTGVMCASSSYFNGRVVLITDSSPADDGTGNPSDTLYPGWTEVSGNHSRLHLNASYWLAKLQ
jgi:hypothetical protein